MSTKNIAILSGGVSFTNYEVSAIYNPTDSDIDSSVIGSIDVVESGAYVPSTSAQSITIKPGYTLYGKFTSVTGNGLVCMY